MGQPSLCTTTTEAHVPRADASQEKSKWQEVDTPQLDSSLPCHNYRKFTHNNKDPMQAKIIINKTLKKEEEPVRELADRENLGQEVQKNHSLAF